ncbi:ATP-binding protein [Fusibacter bizertensis]
MIINKINYKTYGKIADKEINLHSGLNVFYGENESGKSTIFNSIYTTLFGFKPTNREKHPYTNWEKNEIIFSAEISNLEELFLIERSLKSVPKLNVVQLSNGSVQTSRNDTLPFIKNVSDGMFEKVFYLSAEDLNAIDADTWETVQDKMIFNYGSDYLKKTSDVLLSLEQEVNSLWRKDKRGNPQINQLRDEIGRLKIRLVEAEECYDSIKIESENLERVKAEQLSNEILKKERENELKQLRKIIPIKELVEKIQALKSKIYKKSEFELIPYELLNDMKSKEDALGKLKVRTNQLYEDISEVKRQILPMSEQDKKLYDLSFELETLKSHQSELMRLEQEEHSKLEDVIKIGEKIEAQYRLLYGKNLEDGIKERLKKVQVLDLISLLQKYAEGTEANRISEMQNNLKTADTRKINYFIAILGMILMVLGFFFKPMQVVSFLGIGLMGYSLANLLPMRRIENSELVDLTSIYDQIVTTTHGVELPEYVYKGDSQRFLSKLELIITLLYEEEFLYEKRAQILAQKHTLEMQLEKMLNQADLETSRGIHLTLQFALLQMDNIISNIEIEKNKKIKLAHLNENYEQAMSEYRQIENDLNQIYDTISHFGDGDFQMGQEQLLRNFEIQNSLKVFQAELDNYQYDLDILGKVEVTDVERIEAEISSLQLKDKELTHVIIQLNASVENLKNKYNLDEIKSELLFNEEALKDVMRRRDELMVTYEIIKWSDEQFRIKNQPNIIHRVSYFMSVMTDQRYSQVLIKEEDNQYELQFVVDGELISANRAFSKGTIQQLYFAYRLAVIEAMDPENQLPLVLDEALINWDQNRFEATIKILDEISKNRQILFFTCHRSLAMHMDKQLGVNLIEVNS